MRGLSFEVVALAAAIAYPLLVFPQRWVSIGDELTNIFIFAVLALGLNVVVGYAGLLHLGVAAFFGIGAYTTGILTVPGYPFQSGFTVALILSTGVAMLAGLVLGAPTLRLRGDYLAIVTLGFGEVVRFALKNLEEITQGTRGLNPVPRPHTPDWLGTEADWASDYRRFYFLALAVLMVVIVLLRNLERSRLGRAWIAVREDELAAACMGINTPRAKLAAFALGAGLAGMAGCLYATKLGNTAQPDTYDFNLSINMLCCVILGGVGSRRGTILGVVLLLGFQNVLAPAMDRLIDQAHINPHNYAWLTFKGWNLIVYGLALILMMRFRPEGLLPSHRRQLELHEPSTVAAQSH